MLRSLVFPGSVSHPDGWVPRGGRSRALPGGHHFFLTATIVFIRWLRGRKLNPLWYGPFKVIGQPSSVSFQLQLPHDSNLHDTFHVSNLKSATDVTFSKLPRKQISLPAEESDDEEYEVERILDHRWDNRNKAYEYLIQWKGWSSMFENRWEPRAHLDNATELRDEYDRKVGINSEDPVPRIQEGESSTKKLKKSKGRKRKRNEK